MKKYSGWVGLVTLIALVGCGGNTNSASPFSNTTATGSDPIGRGGVRAGGTAASEVRGTVPVFITVKPESLTRDAWMKIEQVELQSAKSQQSVFPGSVGVAVRLSSLRDVKGRRYLFVGEASRSEPLVRVQLTLASKFLVDEPGLDKPVEGDWKGDLKRPKPDLATLSLNLDPNSDFKDAIVLELTMSAKEDDLSLAMALGPAVDVFAPERQERTILVGKFVPPSSIQAGPKITLFETGAETGRMPEELAKDAAISIAGYYVPGRGVVASAILPMGGGEIWRGRLVAAGDRPSIQPSMGLTLPAARANWTLAEGGDVKWGTKPEGELTDKPVFFGWDPKSKKPVTSFAVEGTVTAPKPTETKPDPTSATSKKPNAKGPAPKSQPVKASNTKS
jgi:hypothetical protein